jgi:hypothetical protein
MQPDQLKPNVIVRGPIFREPVQVLARVPMGGDGVLARKKGLVL